MINGCKVYAESPNRIGAFSHGRIVPFQNMSEEFKKYWNLTRFLAIASLRFESNIFSRTQLERSGKITLSVEIVRVMFI